MSLLNEKAEARYWSSRLQVMENIVRNRLESGDPLTAAERLEGVRLSHEEFLYLVRAAMPTLNRDSLP